MGGPLGHARAIFGCRSARFARGDRGAVFAGKTGFINDKAVGVANVECDASAGVGLFSGDEIHEECTVFSPHHRSGFGADFEMGDGAFGLTSGQAVSSHVGVLHQHDKADHFKLVPRVGCHLDIEGGPGQGRQRLGDAKFKGSQRFLPGANLRIGEAVFLTFGKLGSTSAMAAAQGELID